jgi:HlyD family secretion protein
MDRPIPVQEIRRSSQRRYGRYALALAALLAVGYFLQAKFRPSASRQLLRTSVAAYTPMSSAITAAGTVVPEFEQSIASPIDTRLLKVLRRAGDSLRAGEPILLLDLDYVRISIQKNQDQLALKSNALAQMKATYQSQLIALRTSRKNAALDMAYKQTEYEQYRGLLEKKAVARNDFLQKELAYQQAVNLHAQAGESLANLEASTALQEEGLRLEVSILRGELQLLEQQLAQANMRAERAGILTWVMNTEGASIAKGQTLAKVADLSAYRLDVKVADIHAASISVGMPVEAKLQRAGQEVRLRGEVSHIRPTVENGVVELSVALAEPAHPALRPSLRVEVLLVKEAKERALTILPPVFASTEGRYEVFVVRGDRAEKVLLDIGMRSAERIEVLAGLQPGDEVIVSDMGDFKHLSSVALE